MFKVDVYHGNSDCLKRVKFLNMFIWQVFINPLYPTEAPKSLISAVAPCSYNIYISHMKKLVAES